MADAPVVHIGENSPERVAYLMAHDIMNNLEKKRNSADRKYYLDLVAECMIALRSPHTRF